MFFHQKSQKIWELFLLWPQRRHQEHEENSKEQHSRQDMSKSVWREVTVALVILWALNRVLFHAMAFRTENM